MPPGIINTGSGESAQGMRFHNERKKRMQSNETAPVFLSVSIFRKAVIHRDTFRRYSPAMWEIMPITRINYFLFFLFLMIKTMIVMMAAIAKTVTPIANNGLPVTIMAVGPSAPPIIPTEWAFSVEHPLSSITVANMNILAFFISPSPIWHKKVEKTILRYRTSSNASPPFLPIAPRIPLP